MGCGVWRAPPKWLDKSSEQIKSVKVGAKSLTVAHLFYLFIYYFFSNIYRMTWCMITNEKIKNKNMAIHLFLIITYGILRLHLFNLCMFSILFNFFHEFLCYVQNDPSIQLLPPKKKKKRVDCCFFQLRPQNKCNFFEIFQHSNLRVYI